MSVFHDLAVQWGERYRKMSIQMVLSLSFTAVAAAGILLMGGSLIWRFTSSTEKLVAENSQRVLAQANLSLDSYLRRMMRIADTVYYRVIKNTDLAESSYTEALGLLYEENRDDLVSLAVFDGEGGLISAVPLATLKESASPAGSEWFQEASRNMENLHFSTPHVQNIFDDPDLPYRWVVSLSHHVELTRNGVTERGVLLVDMGFSGIEQVCRDVKLANGGYLYLIDKDGELIYHPRQQLIYAGLLEENNQAAAAYRDGSHTESFQGQSRQVTVKTVGYTGWKLVGVTPASGRLTGSSQMLLFGLSLLLFAIFLMAFLNFLISARISDPIRRLDQSVKELERGLDVEIEEGGCYEVQHLSRSVRSMVSTMRHLMQDVIQQEGQKRRSELQVLQSQINPHFLYNTLDSVIWMVESGRQEEAIRMVTSLARFFRISLSKGKNIIPLSDELDHARHYMNIQQIRFKNRFTARIEAQEETGELYTLKLIVQPLLENAIYHGMAGAEDNGEIRVSAYRQDGDLIVDVQDNGTGMPPETVAGLLEEGGAQTGGSGSGIGVRNVHQRIRLTFGEPYGLTILSEPDEGTLVRIRLPALTREQAACVQQGEVL